MPKRLNKSQKMAIQSCQRPTLVMAGAGAGKTSVLTRHIMYLVKHHYANPWNILAVTFTNKAANEMQKRVHQLLPHDTPKNISTFHAAGRRILDYTQYHSKIKINMGNFIPLDPNTQEELIRDILAGYQGTSAKHVAPKYLKQAINQISMAKANVLTPQRIVIGVKRHMDIVNNFIDKYPKMAPHEIYWNVFKDYQHELIQSHELDMDDDIMLPVIILERYGVIRRHFQRLFKYILVDEYQDTNQAQYRLLQLLDGHSRKLFAVGDIDQSIYGWRGANIQNIQNFKKDYHNARIINMRYNYRSTKPIIEASNSIIKYNHLQSKHYRANIATKLIGNKVYYCTASTVQSEANFIAYVINKLHYKKHIPYGDCAILYRLNRQSSPIERTLLAHNIKYNKVQDNSFFKQPIIQILLAYLYVVSNLNSEPSLSRIINVPKRGISTKTYRQLKEYSDSTNQSYSEVLSKIGQVTGLSTRGKKALSKFYLTLLRWRDYCKQSKADVQGLLKHIVADTGLDTMLEKKLHRSKRLIDKAKYQADIDNMYKILNLANMFDNDHQEDDVSMSRKIVSLASYISIHSQGWSITKNKGAAFLMTMHAAKGLQFPIVFIVGLNQETFPDISSDDKNVPAQLHAERRLCYVGMTRAEQRLYLVRPRFVLYGKHLKRMNQSQFVDEINSKYLNHYSVRQKNGHIKVLKQN